VKRQRIRSLPVDPLVRDWLREAKIKTTVDLWQHIGNDFCKGLGRVARKTRIDRPLLLSVLGTGLAQDERWRPTFREVLVALFLLAVVLLLVLRVAEATGLDFPFKAMAVSTKQVVVEGDLPAFREITENDLAEKIKPSTEEGLTDRNKAVGRYLLHPLRKGDVLHARDLGPSQIQTRWIISLSLPSARLGALAERGADVRLILSPRRGIAQGAVEENVTILDVQRNGETALVTVAVPDTQRSSIAAALATSEVFFSTTTP
jgi:hypothetical protein